jgi:hypothetical protein
VSISWFRKRRKMVSIWSKMLIGYVLRFSLTPPIFDGEASGRVYGDQKSLLRSGTWFGVFAGM